VNTDEFLHELALRHTRLELCARTWFQPDGGWPVVEGPPDFVAVVHGGALAYLSPEVSFALGLDPAVLAALQDDARAAVRTGIQGEGGVDTAVGRHVSELRLALDEVDGRAGALKLVFNHPHSEDAFACAPLRRVLEGLREVLARDGRASLAAWDRVLLRLKGRATMPFTRGPVLESELP
jgi:hypothetical protein